MKKYQRAILSLASGLLLFASWPVSPLTFLIFIAFVPFFLIAETVVSRKKFFMYVYLSLLIWNAGTTWWICNASLPGGIMAIILNPLLMSVPWIGYYNVRRRSGDKLALLAILAFWMTFEYIHLNWELTWPWLTLGNVFATHPEWVQWYEYTGTSGGTGWILIVNISVYILIKKTKQYLVADMKMSELSVLLKNHWRQITVVLLALILPILISRLSSTKFDDPIPESIAASKNIVVVQPNIDPYEKFAAGKEEAQLRLLVRLSESEIDSNTALVIWPETAVPVAINEDSMENSYFIQPVWEFLRRHPGVNLLTGIEGFRFIKENEKTSYSQKIPGSNLYIDGYNSAALMDSKQFLLYHKSKFVPGAEVLPSFLRILQSWFEKFGGTGGGYTPQNDRTVLNTYNHTYHIAPSICYESIFGEFMSKYVRNGADIIAIITNDGWWGNTPGYRQHENYARLRAIETRRWVVRSANTGISCFITPYGKVLSQRPWDKTTAIKMPVPLTGEITFFVTNGDLLSKFMVALSILLICFNLFIIIKRRKNRARVD